MQKEYKVGEEIKLGNVTLVVEETQDYGCDDCFFRGLCDNNLFIEVSHMVGDCISDNREAKDNVIFVKVEEE